MNYAVEQRIRFIDFLLDKYGFVNRSTVADYFGISHPTITRDFSLYKSMRPNNIIYSTLEKAYYKSEKFDPIWP